MMMRVERKKTMTSRWNVVRVHFELKDGGKLLYDFLEHYGYSICLQSNLINSCFVFTSVG
jgi:hypothetical protein